MGKIRKILFLLLLAIFAGAVMFLFLYKEKEQENARIYERLAAQKEARETGAGESGADGEEAKDREAAQAAENTSDGETGNGLEKQALEIPVDFDALQAENPDIYAWITIPGTRIDYPVVQSAADDGYYLNHTVDGKEGLPGSIYTESLNSRDFTDPNTVLYGHNMRDGSMFAGLHSYSSEAFMKENRTVYIYTREHIFTYQIFAAVVYDDRHLLKAYNCEEKEEFQRFLDSLGETRNLGSVIDGSVSVQAADRILSLSTCNGQDEQRFLVEAVLTDEQ